MLKKTLTPMRRKFLTSLFDFLSTNSALPVAFRVFASDVIRKQILQSHAKAFSGLLCPVTWISQNQSQVFSLQVQAFSGAAVESVKRQGAIVGCRFVDEDAEYFQLSFAPDDLSADNSQQAAAAFNKSRNILSRFRPRFRKRRKNLAVYA